MSIESGTKKRKTRKNITQRKKSQACCKKATRPFFIFQIFQLRLSASGGWGAGRDSGFRIRRILYSQRPFSPWHHTGLWPNPAGRSGNNSPPSKIRREWRSLRYRGRSNCTCGRSGCPDPCGSAPWRQAPAGSGGRS